MSRGGELPGTAGPGQRADQAVEVPGAEAEGIGPGRTNQGEREHRCGREPEVSRHSVPPLISKELGRRGAGSD